MNATQLIVELDRLHKNYASSVTTTTDLFTKFFVEGYKREIRGLAGLLLTQGEIDLLGLSRGYYDLAFSTLAESVNASFSTSTGRMRVMARATAQRRIAQDLELLSDGKDPLAMGPRTPPKRPE